MPTEPTPAVAPGLPVAEKLREVVRLPTVAGLPRDAPETAAFDALLGTLERLFPLVHARLGLTRIGEHGLLFRWAGSGGGRPVILMAHLDVVPADLSAPWTHPPFDAVVDAGAVWGRGTLDDKGAVVAILEAAETLLADGFTPTSDVWLSFGATEEVSGGDAPAAVDELRRRGVTPWFILDEGGAVAHESFPGVAAPIAVVGVSEKGVTSVELIAEGRGGHASTPARLGPTARIGRALARLDRSPMPAALSDTTVEMLRRMAPHARGPLARLLASAGAMRPVVARALIAAGPESAAMTRTTFALTTLAGAPALNVIASKATAGVNIRVAPGDTVAGAVRHIRRAIRDRHVRIRMLEENEPCPVSPLDDAFELLEATTAEVFPDAVTAPYVMLGATDARHFTRIADRVYRFTPFRMSKAQREAIHAYDERLGVADLADGVRWYRRLIESLPA
ncbi:M20/M25/M40 family metallo-hydrolase [Frondihabitans australicus]|uniref:Carboxypeptidase PM20D1 n=1 Tax=Frondihabitans australicus TaxID=386892 RepID=A0A495IC77_9MICO|nr:M20/M25/M40 family metallo-hydrolase [Frondihabitans australicus]RKR73607.1 carboxypeptidase PM20D1 [Frondihabitans australicus]